MSTVPRSQLASPVGFHRCHAVRHRAVQFLFAVLCATALGACSDSTTAPPALDVSQTKQNAKASTATNILFGDFALHVPENVHRVRGILLALGGPDTRGFANGTSFSAPPSLEPALQELGVMFRELAAERGLAILGSGRFGPWRYPNAPASDQLLLAAIEQAATLTDRPELLDAPILLYGISGGAPEVTGFMQRNPDRVTAMFLKVPLSAELLTGRALDVPAYMVLAGNDTFINNTALSAIFQTNRAAGAPWAMALERDVPHHSLSAAQRQLTVDWMKEMLKRGNAGPFHQQSPHVGWFGDPATGQIEVAGKFEGDMSTASWFAKRALATQWAAFIGM